MARAIAQSQHTGQVCGYGKPEWYGSSKALVGGATVQWIARRGRPRFGPGRQGG